MGAKGRHHYTVEVRPSRDVAGRFTWAIRDHGKLCRASFSPLPSVGQARATAEIEVERLRERDRSGGSLAA